MNKRYLTVNFVVVGLVSLVAFIISYSVLVDIATHNGVSGNLAYLWPLLIDMPIIAFAVNSLVISAMFQKRSYLSAVMMTFFSFASLGFNLAHSGTTWLSIAVAIMPPLALISSFEALRELVAMLADTQHGTASEADTRPITVELTNDTRQDEADTLPLLPDTAHDTAHDTADTQANGTDTAHDDLDSFVATYKKLKLEGITDKDIADKLDVSLSTVNRKKKLLLNGVNGNGQTN